jgi:hypothetical protein
MNKAIVFAALCVIFASQCFAQKYELVDNWYGTNFLENFNFWATGDPTHGYVKYVSQADAQSDGLLNVTANQVFIYSDHTKVATSPGRLSVRLSSKKTYTEGLFIFDLTHMPTGCGTWPAIWTCGPSWPNYGEIDIIEGVNTNTKNTISLHTSNGCTMQGVARKQTGTPGNLDCWTADPKQSNNAGCGVGATNTQSYGVGFNNNGGGIYALWWSNAGLSVWFFPRNGIPADVTSATPTPSAWPSPDANFPFGSNCPSTHFANHQIIVDNTFCGDWAAAVFGSSGCPGSCNNFVQNNPTNFTQSYWGINYFKTFRAS